MALVSALLEPLGMECIEAEWQAHDRILRLFVDRIALADGPATDGATGVNLDDCVRASAALNERAELEDAVSGAFTLEVSSPGIERPLRLRRHFERFVGQKVHVALREKLANRWQAEGVLASVTAGSDKDDALVTLDTEEGLLTFGLGNLKKASLVYDWGH
jgi:ribosome maturation factor RimP